MIAFTIGFICGALAVVGYIYWQLSKAFDWGKYK